MSKYAKGVSVVIGERRYFATHSDLPPVDCDRWTPRRKLAIVVAISGGLLSIAEVCRRYRLSIEEVADWMMAVRLHGERGVRLRDLVDTRRESGQ